MELLPIVWIDEPKCAPEDDKARFFGHTFKKFDGHPGVSDTHQFVNAVWGGTTQFQQSVVDRSGQQMNEGELGGKANTDLLMSPKRIVPGGKSKEYKTFLFQERLDMRKKRSLTKRTDVLYNIMHENNVVAFVLSFWLLNKGKILTEEFPLLMTFCEECPCFVDAPLADVYACHTAPGLGEGEQVAALSAAYFQYTGFAC